MRRIAVYQGSAVQCDKAANLQQIRRAAAAASAMGADVLVLPELFLTGYNIGQAVHELAESHDGPSLADIRQTAQHSGCALCVGFPERAGNKVFNSTALISSRGEQICVYRKIHLFGEQETALFSRGEELAVATLAGRHVGLAICYDIEFPEFARELKRRGAEAVLVPTANMEPYAEVPTTLVRARALENGVTVAYANHCGSENGMQFTGLSGITGPDGLDLARAGVNTEVLLVAELPPTASLGPLSSQLADLRL
jgi:predicted amidohydrolase